MELFDKYNFVENGLEECEEQSNVNGTKWDKIYNIKIFIFVEMIKKFVRNIFPFYKNYFFWVVKLFGLMKIPIKKAI